MERAEAKLLSHNKIFEAQSIQQGRFSSERPSFYFLHKPLDTSKARMNHAVSCLSSVVSAFQLATDH
jgi:hypothetical protein